MTSHYRLIVASAIWCLSLCFAPPVWSQQRGAVERTMALIEKQLNAGSGSLMFFVDGAGRALEWANSDLRVGKRSPLYCEPEKLNLNRTNYAQTILEEYKSDKATYDRLDKTPLDALVWALLMGQQKTFPCK